MGSPTPISMSTTMAFRLYKCCVSTVKSGLKTPRTSVLVMLLARTDAMLYNRRVIHSSDAGIATASPTMNRDAGRDG